MAMENWRRQKWDNHRQELPRKRSEHKKPPRGSWQPRVPSWEKEFLRVVGSLDWDTFLHAKKFIHLYNNVIEWNDSAGKEAFNDAKKRFWAEKQGVPCDVSLPDPDLYIDKINWGSEIDPELLLELERKPEIPNADERHETVVIFGDALLANQAFLSSGWGDNEENFKIPTNESPANYGDPWEHHGAANGWTDYPNNTWHDSGGWNNNGWNNYEVKPVKPKNFEDKKADYVQGSWHPNNMGRAEKPKNFEDKKADYIQGSWDPHNTGRADDAGRYLSRYKTTRYQGDEHCKNQLWWKDRGRRR